MKQNNKSITFAQFKGDSDLLALSRAMVNLRLKTNYLRLACPVAELKNKIRNETK